MTVPSAREIAEILLHRAHVFSGTYDTLVVRCDWVAVLCRAYLEAEERLSAMLTATREQTEAEREREKGEKCG